MVKKLTIVTVALILLNVTLLAFIFLHRPRGPRERGNPTPKEAFDRLLVRRLELTESQKQAYIQQTQEHRQRHQALSLALLEVKHDIHHALATEDEVALQQLLPQMDSVHSLREREVVKYARTILGICDEEQKEKFLQLLTSSIEGRQGFHRRRRNR